MSDIAIKVENVSKMYRLGDVGTGSLGTDITSWWAKVRGKENPNSKIAVANDRSQKAISDFVWSLQNIDFEIKKGDAVGIIGKNGAGKSTLLKILSRTTSPTTGVISINGRVASLLEVGTGFHGDLSGKENIYMNGAILGMTRKEITSKLDEIIDFSGVAGYIDTPVKRYSSGMYVRLAFAVAAHLDPDIMIIDEVLAVGDAEFQKKCLGKMQDVNSLEGRTVIFVSHNIEAVQTLCKTAILLKNGQLMEHSSVNNIIEKYVLADQVTISNIRTDYSITDNILIEKLTLSKKIIHVGQSLEFELLLHFTRAIKIDAAALILYTQREIRVAVIDLRNISKHDGSNNKFNVSGSINELNLIPGIYRFGLYINCELYHGDVNNLVEFQIIDPVVRDIIPYPASVRGITQLDTTFY